jgi:hypothetical protein
MSCQSCKNSSELKRLKKRREELDKIVQNIKDKLIGVIKND